MSGMREHFEWQTGRRTLVLGPRTLIMGVVNVTPDSFSDGGDFASSEKAVTHALNLLKQGADILDIGGESTRPGAAVVGAPSPRRRASVSAEEELARILPVIEGVRRTRPDTVISVDTYKAEVARAAVGSGAEIVNDVSGFAWDPESAGAVAELGCGCVLMHTRGQPEEWRTLPPFEDPVGSVFRELRVAAGAAVQAGVKRSHIVLDPGFGFGKNFDENYPLLAHFDEFAKLGYPLLSGPSRKSFLGRTVGRRLASIAGVTHADLPPKERLQGTMAAVVASIMKGAHIVRVHDVREAVEAAAVADAVLAAE